MKTRKRALPAANSSAVSATVTQETTNETRYSPGFWLRLHDFVEVPVGDQTDDILAVAVKAFQAQLEVFSKQSPRHRHAGFKQLARKHRLEFRAGDEALGQLGLLQGLATTVVQTLDDIARKHLQGLEESLQLPAGAFSPLVDSRAVDSNTQSSSSLEAIHYMLPEGAAAYLGSLEACEAHEDKGLLTVIYADTEQGLQVVGAPGGCPTARNALVYKLRAPDTAVLDLYAALSKHYFLPPRYQSSIGVGELMHFFDATHTSVNALPAPEPKHELQPTVISTKNSKTGSQPPLAPSTNSSQGVQLKVLVRAEDELPQAFLIHSNTPLRSVFQAFCLQRGFSMSDSTFLLDGCVLYNGTAEQNDLEPGDVIQHFTKQVGD